MPSTKDIPVILLSAKGRNVDQKVGFEVGADDYITKPFSPRKLVERINAILGQTSRQDAARVGAVVRKPALPPRPSHARPSRASARTSRGAGPEASRPVSSRDSVLPSALF